ncbi:MAG: carbohydrate kinase family protein [Oscillospiraceae bacterium]|nr:carbohydrate kinase family protein [Oscillospiraceae bacterium]
MLDVRKMIDALERSTGKITLFVDGFVDEVWQIVGSRASTTEFALFTQMSQYTERVQRSGTGGVGLEILRKRRSAGGFCANTGCATARLGVDTTLVCLYGKDNLDPVFTDVGKLCKLISIEDPAVTHILEFDDGKIMMSYVELLHHLNWKFLTGALGKGKLTRLLADSDIIGVGYWSVLPAFDEIVEQICANLPADGKQRRLFFDFADFRKNDPATLTATLQHLRDLNEKVPMTLSVNEHEAMTLFAMYGQTLDDADCTVSEKTEFVRGQLGLDELVVHTLHYAAAASAKEKPAFAASIFCEKPLRTAGAGDTFNGGYLAASLAGLNLAERLHVANATVGGFLRSATSPDTKNLTEYFSG